MTDDAGTPSEFSFMQLADPQIGLFAVFSERSPEELAATQERFGGLPYQAEIRGVEPMAGFAPETGLFTEAIQTANRTRPAFVVVCGDIVQDPNDDAQAQEAHRIAGLLDEGIDLHWVAGNHDVGYLPTPESLKRYRAGFGPDNYTFQQDDTSFIVLNSSIMQYPQEIPDEWKLQLQFLGHELEEARRSGSAHIVLFTHIPLFIRDPEENDPPNPRGAIPLERRQKVLKLLRQYEADAVFAGHLHGNIYANDGPMEMVISGALGYPFSDDKSGYRNVHVTPDSIDHRWSQLNFKPPFIDVAPD